MLIPNLALHEELPALVLLASILFVLFRRPHGGGNQPPSPPGIPVFGHLHLLGKLPHRSLLKLSQKYGPLMKLRFGSVPLLFASNAAMASEFLKTQDHVFASRPGNKTIEMLNHPKDLILAPYGDYWRNLRMLCAQELLSERNMLAHQEKRMREVSYLLLQLQEAAQKNEAVKLRDLLSEYTYNTLLEMIIGKAYAGRQHEKNMDAEEIKLFKDYKKVTQDMAFVTGQFHVSDYVNIPFLSMFGSSRDRKKTIQPGIVDAFWKRVIQEHREKEHADFLASLMSKSDNTKQHENQIKAFLQGLISAGTDATAITIEWAIAELLHHPEILDAVIKETFRLHTPVPLTIPHMSMEDSGKCQTAFGQRDSWRSKSMFEASTSRSSPSAPEGGAAQELRSACSPSSWYLQTSYTLSIGGFPMDSIIRWRSDSASSRP